MPDFDSGHIFLTTLAPIKLGAPEDTPDESYEQTVRVLLETLPVAHQSPATVNGKFNSPFARNARNHLVRMFVLDDIVYNGRKPQNPVVGQILGTKLVTTQKVDRLNTPYLVFCADIDAVASDGDKLPKQLSSSEQEEVRRLYAAKLWQTMEIELRSIYSNCYGFEKVNSAEDFADYLEKCHVETTMPFHDYYLQMPDLNTVPLKKIVYLLAAPLILGIVTLALWLFGMATVPFFGWSSILTSIVSLVIFAFLLFGAWWNISKNGLKPFPPGEYDDLPSVLKALYIQQMFSDFFIENQTSNPQDLHKNFGNFIKKHAPSDKFSRTQKPGEISSTYKRNRE